ncbi:BLUF domain-containing protein [Salipiger sp. P9]|uniref:BLUF domain-containing protein n=1 Tax=Salipiger pentaromativorans TaxID=2943193 RepID=UPI002156F99C|nr:BLUF domain-containing protein [Salipiger pentaromativorans]MCR8550927.1 BLUF domain-containing protein [Salipiger pentaromativorans]
MITQLLYTSASRHPRGHSSDFEILQDALSHNRVQGVTGYLLRDIGGFCQVLEGPAEIVEPLFARISGDPRHSDVVLRMRRQVPERGFLGWSMGYASLSPEDSAFLATCFAEGAGGILLAFERIGRVASGQD